MSKALLGGCCQLHLAYCVNAHYRTLYNKKKTWFVTYRFHSVSMAFSERQLPSVRPASMPGKYFINKCIAIPNKKVNFFAFGTRR